MNVAALIIGIDGWDKYTWPLIDSIKQHEPTCELVVIDNASEQEYPPLTYVWRTERLCYSAAINEAWRHTTRDIDWFIVLSNDVLCTGPFKGALSAVPEGAIAGPLLKRVHDFPYLEGWCVCIPNLIWSDIGGWDEGYQVSSWEDVDYSVTALERGYNLACCWELPFKHLDQKQRFTIVPDYWDSEDHNIQYFKEKHGG